MQTTISTLTTKLAVLTAAMALTGAAFAAGKPAPSTDAPATASAASAQVAAPQGDKARVHRHHHRHGAKHRHMRDAAMWVPGYGPLSKEVVQSLSLTPEQSALLEQARGDQQEERKARRATMKSAHAARIEQIKAGKIDPEAMLKQSEQMREQSLARKRERDARWLAVWKSLDEAQQGKVVSYLNERAEKFAKRVQAHKERHQQKRSGQQGADARIAS